MLSLKLPSFSEHQGNEHVIYNTKTLASSKHHKFKSEYKNYNFESALLFLVDKTKAHPNLFFVTYIQREVIFKILHVV